MAFILKYKDKDEIIDKEIRFFDRHSAEINMERLKRYGHTEVRVDDSFNGNQIEFSIRITGFTVLIVGIIIGIVQGNYTGKTMYGEFSFSVALYWWVGSIVVGALLIGIAEIIHLLEAIHKRMK